MKYKAAIFDMDGTILDTIEDLKNAICYALAHEGHRGDYSSMEVEHFVGSGALVAFERALAYEDGTALEDLETVGIEEDYRKEAALPMWETFQTYYPDHCEENTQPFPGLTEALDELRGAGVRLAVVSNKIDTAVHILAEKYFPGRFDFTVGISDTNRRKPFPDMLQRCLEFMAVKPEEAVYIGDSEVDIQTAANMGMPCISVTWGNRREEYLRENGATVIVRETSQLPEAII